MKAIYVSSPYGKNGKMFHIYNVVGTTQELEDYKNSPNFKQYPSFGENGEVQYLTNFISMEDEVPMIKKRNGDYTLDNSKFNKDIARLNAVAEASSVLANKFAERLADGMTSATASVRTKSFKVVEETVEDTTDSLDNM